MKTGGVCEGINRSRIIPLSDPPPGVAEKEAAPISLCIDIYDASILCPFESGPFPPETTKPETIGVNI